VVENDKKGAGKSLESDMLVYQKWEDMAAYLYTALKSYPKSERFTLAANTSTALWDIGTDIARAASLASRNEKRNLIEHADIALVKMKVLVRMGVRLGLMPLKKYEIICGQVMEIGKMLGGWKKSVIGGYG
jgi:four helix bundle protein